MNDDVLIRAEHVSKKFCRSLKRSLWYGAQDVARSLLPWGAPSSADHDESLADFRLPPLREDEFWAVRDVSFEVRRGECLGLIGHNGAGKSTLLKILNSLNRPDTGRITMRGRVGALIELSAGFNPILSGRENIYNQASLLGFTRQEIDSKFDAIVDFSELEEFLDMPLQNYSSGMKVRLGFAVSSQMEPDVLIIDEVLAVGDVSFRYKCLNAIGELMKSAAVIFVTHSVPLVFRICNEVMVLDHGSPTFMGRDVAEGVRIYLSMVDGGGGQSISGSGEVEVTGFEMKAGDSLAGIGETLPVSFGSFLKLHVRLRSQSALQDLRIEFLLWNEEMLPVFEILTQQLMGFQFSFPASGEIDISADVPQINTTNGKYSLSVTVTNSDHSRILCRVDNAAFLRVEAATPSGAHVISVADWRVFPSE